MSWGERSCKHSFQAQRPCKPEIQTCNVNCQFYVWNGTTKPDSEKTLPMTTEQVRAKTAQMKEWYDPNGTTAKHPIFPNVPRA